MEPVINYPSVLTYLNKFFMKFSISKVRQQIYLSGLFLYTINILMNCYFSNMQTIFKFVSFFLLLIASISDAIIITRLTKISEQSLKFQRNVTFCITLLLPLLLHVPQSQIMRLSLSLFSCIPFAKPSINVPIFIDLFYIIIMYFIKVRLKKKGKAKYNEFIDFYRYDGFNK